MEDKVKLWVGEVRDRDAGHAGEQQCASSNGDESTGVDMTVDMSSVTPEDGADQVHVQDSHHGDGAGAGAVLDTVKCDECDEEVVR